jgi:LysM repeat protein
MDFLTAQLPRIWIALLSAALVFHVFRLASPGRWLHAAYAASAAGLIALLGARTYGWSAVSPEFLLWVFVALLAIVAAVAVRRRMALGAIGLPWLSALVQLAAVAYMFAPAQYWKPPLAFLLLLYFAAELIAWIRGQEEADAAEDGSGRPPLFPPKRQRGLTEASLAAAVGALIYLLAVGPRAPVPEEPQQEAATEPSPETAPASADHGAAPATESAAAQSGSSTTEEPASGAAPVEAPKAETPPALTYTVVAGDTFKTIAKRVLGDRKKWRAIADANPGVNGARLRAGQAIKLPDVPRR